jgi:hypothetical protein
MIDAGTVRHYSAEEIVGYFLRITPRGEAADLERHLAGCDLCAFRARGEYAESGVSGRWWPEAHSVAITRESLAAGLLGAAAVVEGGARQRFLSWANEQAGRWTAAVRVFKRGSRIETVLLGLGAPAAAEGRLGSGPRTVVALAGEGVPAAEVVRTAEGSLYVRLAGVGPGERPPLALIIPTDKPENAQRLKFVFNPRSSSWVAWATHVPEDVIVAVAPDFEV